MRFKIGSFNVKNLIGPDEEYYRFEDYTPEEFAWKKAWLADQLLTMNADVVCFQEIFAEDALRAVIAETDARAAALNAAVIPPADRGYGKKAIYRKLSVQPYDKAALAFAPNIHDGSPGNRRPGVAVLSRFGFDGPPQVLQRLEQPLRIPFRDLGGPEGGTFTLTSLSRPVLKVRVPVGETTVTIFNCHLKSKLGEYIRPAGAAFAPEEDLIHYDPAGRALGSLRAGVRRMAEAFVLRAAIIGELQQGRPVMVLGDFNDGENAVSTQIIAGEAPFRNYAWMRRHDATHEADRYTKEEDRQIRAAVERVRLVSAESLFLKRSLRDMVFTSAFGGVYESIDQIFLSPHFNPDNPQRLGEMEYFSTLNDHLTDGSLPEAPYNKLASDHGQIVCHMRIGQDD